MDVVAPPSNRNYEINRHRVYDDEALQDYTIRFSEDRIVYDDGLNLTVDDFLDMEEKHIDFRLLFSGILEDEFTVREMTLLHLGIAMKITKLIKRVETLEAEIQALKEQPAGA